MGRLNRVFIIKTLEEFEYICNTYIAVDKIVDHSECIRWILNGRTIYIREEDAEEYDKWKEELGLYDGKVLLWNTFSGDSSISYFNYTYDYNYELIIVGEIMRLYPEELGLITIASGMLIVLFNHGVKDYGTKENIYN